MTESATPTTIPAGNPVTRVLFYLGMGALAHWLWIGEHVDPQTVFTWVCLLLGPLMTLAWLIKAAAWWMLLLLVISVLAALAIVGLDDAKRLWRRAKR